MRPAMAMTETSRLRTGATESSLEGAKGTRDRDRKSFLSRHPNPAPRVAVGQ